MWGTHPLQVFGKRFVRFIPTHVGNSRVRVVPPALDMVHPHACGELGSGRREGITKAGSSPRMWGTRLMYSFNLFMSWFIPTHVGNSFTLFCPEPAGGVHPHACGELCSPILPAHSPSGSSPRMWGTLAGVYWIGELEWFIPTHVGNSATAPIARVCQEVHPHACGELTRPLFPPFLALGSSPRMWGTLL